MSKSELKEEKKRKRQEDEAVDAPKKSKKSKQSQDAAVTKEKKENKSKKDKDVASDEPATPAAAEEPVSEEGSAETSKSKKDKKSKKSKKSKADAEADKEEKKSKKEKKDKKDKKSKSNGEAETAEPMDVDVAVEDVAAEETSEKKSKKDKKEKKEKKDKKEKKEKKDKKAEKTSDDAAPEALDEPNGAEDQAGQPDGEAVDGEEAADPNARFIVFIGNLPFSATKEQIEEHFAKLKPFEVRLRTYKDSGKSMGCGFIEFERYDHMQTALMKYHHSVFPDPKKKEGRKINVELSAGGGGNTAARKEKIAVKNEKLANERQRNHEKRAEIETKQKERKDKKESKAGKDKVTNGETEEAGEESATAGIHPARLAMMNQPERPQKQFKPNLGNVPKFKGGPPPRPRRY